VIVLHSIEAVRYKPKGSDPVLVAPGDVVQVSSVLRSGLFPEIRNFVRYSPHPPSMATTAIGGKSKSKQRTGLRLVLKRKLTFNRRSAMQRRIANVTIAT
jgi:hypothetical protein